MPKQPKRRRGGDKNPAAAPRKAQDRPSLGAGLVPLLWLAVLCTALATHPDLMSGNYLPKTLAASLTLALGFLLVPPQRPLSVRLTTFGLLWALYAAWALLSALWAPQDRVVLERWVALMIPTLGYLLARRLRFWESEGFWDGFCILLGAIGGIGMLQINPGGIAPDFLHEAAGWFTGTAVPRATLGHRNYASLFFMLGAPLLAWRYYTARKPWRSGLALAVLAASLIFILYARTRGVWLGMLFMSAFLLVGGAWRKAFRRPKRSSVLAVGAVLAVAFALLNSAAFLKGLGAKENFAATLERIADPSNRLPMWRDCLGITNPLIGGGFGCFPIHATPQSPDAKVKTLNWEVHNDYLQAFLDLGLPGVGLFAAAFAVALWCAWRGRRDSLVLAAGAGLFAFSFLQFTTFLSEKVSSQLMIAGILAIVIDKSRPRIVFEKRTGYTPPLLAGYAAAIGLLALSFGVSRTIWGDWMFRNTNTMISKVSRINDILTHPDKYSPEELGNARAQAPTVARAFQQRLKHLAEYVYPRMPFDANMRHITAHTFAGTALLARNYPVAEAFAKEALKLHPNDHTSMGVLGSVAYTRKDHDRAIEWFEKAVELKQPETSMRLEIALANFYSATGRSAEAAKLLDSDLAILGELDNPYSKALQTLIQLQGKAGNRKRAENLKRLSERNRVGKPKLKTPAPETRLASTQQPDQTDVRFEWEGAPGALKYRLQVIHAGKGLWEDYKILETSDLCATVTLRKTKPGMRYSWSVRAVGKYRTVTSEFRNILFRDEQR